MQITRSQESVRNLNTSIILASSPVAFITVILMYIYLIISEKLSYHCSWRDNSQSYYRVEVKTLYCKKISQAEITQGWCILNLTVPTCLYHAAWSVSIISSVLLSNSDSLLVRYFSISRKLSSLSNMQIFLSLIISISDFSNLSRGTISRPEPLKS